MSCNNQNLLVGGETSSFSSQVCGSSTVGNVKLTKVPLWHTSGTGKGRSNTLTPPINYTKDFAEHEESLGIRRHLLEHNTATGRSSLPFFSLRSSGVRTIPLEKSFHPLAQLMVDNISVDDFMKPSVLAYQLRKSKINSLWGGIKIALGQTQNEFCPISAQLSYLQRRGKKNLDHLFVFRRESTAQG